MSASKKPRLKVLGLTGGIGSGKSTVAGMLGKLDVPVLCADTLAHQALEPESPAYRKIIRAFGKEILKPDRRIHRPALGAIVFASAAKRRKLNALVHPEVIRGMKRWIRAQKKKKARLAVLDVPLLFETKLDRLCDTTAVVYAPERLMKKRVAQRDGLDARQIRERIASQWPIEKKKKKADYVIDNSGSPDNTFRQIKALISSLRSS